MREKAVMDERGWIRIPSAIRMRAGLLKKTDIVITHYGNEIIIVSSASDGKFEDAIKKAQAVREFEEAFKTMHAKNLGVSDEEIAEEIREYRKVKRGTGPTR